MSLVLLTLCTHFITNPAPTSGLRKQRNVLTKTCPYYVPHLDC